jgi:drug/metabolite transporter (DMT)-like permease
MPHQALFRHHALLMLGIVVLAWGTNWPVTKMIVREMSPLWSTALRCAIAAVVLALLLWLRGEFIIPKRGDVAVVLSTSLLHMTAYSALIAAGLQFLPAGRAIVLGYTTPIWVTLGARIFLSEAITARRAIGAILGLGGLAVIFNPGSLEWGDHKAVVGSGLIMLAAFFWAANIVYVRAHKWVSSPFQLVFWQVLLACSILSIMALFIDGVLRVVWTSRLVALLLFSGIFCTALAHWSMSMANRSLPAVITSLGLLATPALGIASSNVFLGETLEPALLVALALIIGGIAVGIVGDRRQPEPPCSQMKGGLRTIRSLQLQLHRRSHFCSARRANMPTTQNLPTSTSEATGEASHWACAPRSNPNRPQLPRCAR